MSVLAKSLFAFDDSFVRELEGLYVPWHGAAVSAPRLLVLNEPLAAELGADAEALRTDDGMAVLAGTAVPEGTSPVAQAYAGHQFGAYSPRLGDGRALLVGEVIDAQGGRRDLHLKGSGRTPFARGGDGKAAVGPMLREYVVGEAMHALGIPTSRALAVVATGERVMRDAVLPGAVLARVAASHIRVGTFQYAAMNGGPDLVKRLADYSLRRHFPEVAEAENPYLDFYERVVDAQASLVAQWMLVGFIHGVMNTDNMAISGETIDYGPCAFMDAFDPGTVFSSIDYGGRYAYGNQPADRTVEPGAARRGAPAALDDDTDAAVAAATETLERFPERFNRYWRAGMRAKLGWDRGRPRRAARAPSRASARLHLHVPHPGGVAARRGAPAARPPGMGGALARAVPRPRRDGPRQSDLHPAQPPRRGGAGRRDRRRSRAAPSAGRRGAPSVRGATRLGVLRRPGPRELRALPHLLRDLAPRSHQASLVGEYDRLDAVARAELRQDMLDVGLDGRLAEDQIGGDL